jgi:hypothetical protein
MSRGMLNGTLKVSLQSVNHVQNLLFTLHSRHFLVEKMIKLHMMNDVLDLFNSTIIHASKYVRT